jgi:histidinol-phosphate aminotransferase
LAPCIQTGTETLARDLPFTEIIAALPATVPFVGPEALERQTGRRFKVRLGANESAFGLSPLALAAMRRAVEDSAWYCDPECFALQTELARHHGVDPSQILVGAGIDELLGLTVRLFVSAGDTVVTSAGAYPTFSYHVLGFGGRLLEVPYRDDREDPKALLDAAISAGARLVYLANPDNPMGSWNQAAEIKRAIARLPSDCLLILDEAYCEFAPAESQWELEPDDARVLRMRTFSKAHGMAGARIGYAIAHEEVVAALNKIRNQFGVNRIAQEGALASLGDQGFVDSVVREVRRGREEYRALGEELGVPALPSATNFVALDIGSGARARELQAALLQEAVFVRMPGVSPLDRCIRVTVGTAEERQQFAATLRAVLPNLTGAAQ